MSRYHFGSGCMRKGKQRRNAKAKDARRVSLPFSQHQNTPIVEKSGYEDLFRGLETEPAEVPLCQPGSGTQTSTSAVCSDAQCGTSDYQINTCSESGWDTMTDRSASSFEVVDDEATRDLARTPSPDEYYDKPESVNCSRSGEARTNSGQSPQPPTTQHKGGSKHEGGKKGNENPPMKNLKRCGNTKKGQHLHITQAKAEEKKQDK